MLSNEKWFGASAPFYDETIDQSLRFQSAHLERTPSSASNQKTWTFSCWFKIGNTGANHTLWSAGATGTPRLALYLSSGGQLITDLAGTGTYDQSVARFRDTSNWYHLVWAFDTTQATGSNRSRMYINGTEITLTKTRTFSLNTNYAFNGTVKHTTGGLSNSTSTFASNLYLAEVNFVDGTQLTPTSFGESKNGIWIPIEISGLTYSTNGFRLTFADSSSIGDDTSGNTNDYSTTGLASTDVVLDSPTNNFCTLNALSSGDASDLSEGNLQYADNRTGGLGYASSTFQLDSGKWYWEVYYDYDNGSNMIGVGNQNTQGISHLATDSNFRTDSFHWDERGYYYKYASGTFSQTTGKTTYAQGDVISFALDVDAGKMFIRKNNNAWEDSGDPVAGTNASYTFTANLLMTPSIGNYLSSRHIFNFGQEPTFAGHLTAGTETDSGGIGLFKYAPPTDYLAICSSNLSDTTLSPNQTEQATDYMGTALWSGNDTARKISLGFQADWVWTKMRSHANSHYAYDSSRGDNEGLFPDLTQAETTTSGAVSFGDADGFDLGTYTQTNGSGYTFVGWCWKANGGTTSSNTDGSITSTVQASTDAGFSIITYTGNGTAGATIGHGLGVKPAMIIIKRRTGTAQDWMVYHHKNTSAPATDYLSLNRNFATQDTNVIWNDTEPDTSVITLGGHDSINQNTQSHVAYVFADVEGYSKFGSYTGNGSTDGTFVYTGFRPAWVLIKQTNSTGSWLIHDNKRSPFNVIDEDLFANLSSAESDNGVDKDFLSNGFKHRASHSAVNGSSSTYIYMAFAEQPFKFSNAR